MRQVTTREEGLHLLTLCLKKSIKLSMDTKSRIIIRKKSCEVSCFETLQSCRIELIPVAYNPVYRSICFKSGSLFLPETLVVAWQIYICNGKILVNDDALLGLEAENSAGCENSDG
jgi:hypothetical protein